MGLNIFTVSAHFKREARWKIAITRRSIHVKTKILSSLAAMLLMFGFAVVGNAGADTPAKAVTSYAGATISQTSQETKTTGEKTFTKTQLAKFDGKNGSAAYVAYEGIVYDVSSRWEDGEHHGIKAGADITSRLNNCSFHEDGFFKTVFIKYNFPKVGVFVNESGQ
jgi:predicted heme/steroid binding protein